MPSLTRLCGLEASSSGQGYSFFLYYLSRWVENHTGPQLHLVRGAPVQADFDGATALFLSLSPELFLCSQSSVFLCPDSLYEWVQ